MGDVLEDADGIRAGGVTFQNVFEAGGLDSQERICFFARRCHFTAARGLVLREGRAVLAGIDIDLEDMACFRIGDPHGKFVGGSEKDLHCHAGEKARGDSSRAA